MEQNLQIGDTVGHTPVSDNPLITPLCIELGTVASIEGDCVRVALVAPNDDGEWEQSFQECELEKLEPLTL